MPQSSKSDYPDNITRQTDEINSMLDRLRKRADSNRAIADFVQKTLTSVRTELQIAQKNAAPLQILDVLNHVNSEVTHSIAYEERRLLLDRIAEAVHDIIDADIVVLYEAPETGDRLKARPGIAGELFFPKLMLNEMPRSSVIYSYLSSNEIQFVEKVLEQPLLVSPTVATDTTHKGERFSVREEVMSTVICPLMFSGSRVGLMFANYRTEQSFDSERQSAIQEIVRHIALAMYNMRSSRRVAEFNSRLATLFQIVVDITENVISRQKVLERAIRGMVELIDAPRGSIVDWDSDKSSGIVVAEYSVDRATTTVDKSIPKDLPLSKRILSGEAYVITDVSEDRLLSMLDRDILISAGIKSVLIVPIVNEQGRVVASIGIDETRFVRAFPENEITLCKILAGQVAIALRLAESIGQDQRNAAIMALLQEALTVLSQTDDPDVAFEFIVREGLRLIDGANGQLLRVNFEEKFLETDYSTIISEIGLRYPLHSSITGMAALTKFPVNIADLNHPDYKGVYQPGYDVSTIRSELAVPLVDMDNNVIGVLNAESTKSNAFSIEHETIWQSLASGMVTVVKLAELKAEKAALTSLAEIQQQFSQTQISDPKPVLKDIIDRAMKLADAGDDGIGQLLLLHDDHHHLTIEHSTLFADIGQKVRVDNSISGLALLRKETVYIENLDVDEYKEGITYRDLHQWFAETEKMKSELAVPLMFNGDVIGVINLEKSKTYAFTELHAKLVRVLASQAALIIQQAKVRDQELKQILEEQQNRDIANILHRLNNPLGLIRQYTLLAKKTLGDPQPSITSVRNDLTNIEDSVDRIAILIRDLRDQLRNVEARPIDVNEVTRRAAVDSWPMRIGQSSRSHVEPDLLLANDLPQASCGDKLDFVIMDLLDNAFEAAIDGRDCVIRLKTLQHQDGLEIQIIDNGIGIPKERWELIFDEAFHMKKLRPNDDSGGIGLWWGRKYVRGYGGDLFVAESTVGEGTTMAIRLKRWPTVQ